MGALILPQTSVPVPSKSKVASPESTSILIWMTIDIQNINFLTHFISIFRYRTLEILKRYLAKKKFTIEYIQFIQVAPTTYI